MKPDQSTQKTTRPDPNDPRVVLVSASLRQPRPPERPAAAGGAVVRPVAEAAGRAAGSGPAGTGPASVGPSVGAPAGGRADNIPPVWRRRESFWAEVASWSAILFAVIIGVSVLGWFYWTGDSHNHSSFFSRLLRRGGESQQAAVAPPPAPERRRAIDGRPLAAGVPDTDHFAVMIENMVDSRPLAGLAEAALVIEAPVEGGITRFLAFYPPGSAVSRIGPVRSARPYYLDWAQEFDALYIHVGGSPEALDDIKSVKLRDLNQFSWGKYFWRDSGRSAPHNVYTSADLLAKGLADVSADHKTRAPAAWRFKDDIAPEDRPQETADIVVDYSTSDYRVTWKYDRAANEYQRWQGDSEQRDESGAPVRAKNVVIQYSQIRILDEIGRRRIETLGEGQALLALDGKTFAAVWKKPAAAERTRYYDESGAEIALNAGATWVEIVPAGAAVKY